MERRLGKIVARLVAEVLFRRRARSAEVKFQWISRPMGALVDLADKDAVYETLDRGEK